MKNITLLVTVSLFAVSYTAEARDKSTRSDNSVRYTQAASESIYSSRGAGNFGLGFSTIQATVPGGTSAITATIDLSRVDALQAFFSIPQTSPFNIGAAVLYKRTIAESRGAGFHIGGGLGMGNINTGFGSAFAMNFSAVGGFHFEMPGIPHISVHLDGGPTFNLITTSPSTTTNFQIAALSPALGASILYIF